jgi:hypothetical protein
MTLPLTIGMWDKSKPVEVKLVKGKNVGGFKHQVQHLDY